MTHRVTKNFFPFRFHEVHGEGVTLSKNGTVACRDDGFCNALVFSNRPMMPCEPIYIRFVEVSKNWTGTLRVGFTMHDPVSLKSKLPKYLCPELTNSEGSWAKAVPDRLAKKDNILYYYANQDGDVHYGVNTIEYGVFFSEVDTSDKIWAVMDIYGNSVAIEVVDPYTLGRDIPEEERHPDPDFPLRKRTRPEDYDMRRATFSCYLIHAKNILLKKNGSVVQRKPLSRSHCYVFTQYPMKPGYKLLIQVLRMACFYENKFIFGVTSVDPSTIDPDELPENADDLLDRPEYWIVKQHSYAFRASDLITCVNSLAGEFSVTVNRKYVLAKFHVDPTQPVWLFFNLIGRLSEMWLIGVVKSDDVKEREAAKYESTEDEVKILEVIEAKPGPSEAKPGPSSEQTISSECVICCTEPVNCVLYRCGHMCLCYNCAMKMWSPGADVQCPICREPIQDVIKAFL